MDRFTLMGIICIIASIFQTFYYMKDRDNESKIGAIIFFILGIVFIIVAFTSNLKLGYLIFGLTFISIGISILYQKKKNPEDKTNSIATALMCIVLGILGVSGVFIPD